MATPTTPTTRTVTGKVTSVRPIWSDVTLTTRFTISGQPETFNLYNHQVVIDMLTQRNLSTAGLCSGDDFERFLDALYVAKTSNSDVTITLDVNTNNVLNVQ